MMELWPDDPVADPADDRTREESIMYPGPNDTDWQVAKLRHRENIAAGQHQQSVGAALATTSRGLGAATVQRRFVSALAGAGRRFLRPHAVTEGLGSVTVAEGRATA
jgi:hypothetical protein